MATLTLTIDPETLEAATRSPPVNKNLLTN
jgi:hypothetical protein